MLFNTLKRTLFQIELLSEYVQDALPGPELQTRMQAQIHRDLDDTLDKLQEVEYELDDLLARAREEQENGD